MKRVLVSKFSFSRPFAQAVTQELRLPPIRAPLFLPHLVLALARYRETDLLFASNPGLGELSFAYLAQKISRRRLKVVVFDLILGAPRSRAANLSAWLKKRLLGAVDCFACIHKDLSGYERHFGIDSKKCVYVPFKANNYSIAWDTPIKDGGYIVALGASQRDYGLLIQAVALLGYPLTIVLPRGSIAQHNASFPTGPLPASVRHVSRFVDGQEYTSLLAACRFAVVPILPDVIQPAGISVYLEAMALAKPVLVTEGASTKGILDRSLAVLVPAGDLDALVTGLRSLWEDVELRERLARNSRQYALGLGGHERLVADLHSLISDQLRLV